MRVVWLAEVLRAAGLHVVEMPGWKTRGAEMRTVNGVIYHGTVTGPNQSDRGVADLLVKGRPDLKGPLSQVGMSRPGVFYVIASGRCSHNGFGRWGNDSIGIEEFNWNGYKGIVEPYNTEAAARGTAAILRRLGHTADRVLGHKESDPGRKSDPLNVDMHEFRRSVARLLTGSGGFLMALSDAEQQELLNKVRAITTAIHGDPGKEGIAVRVQYLRDELLPKGRTPWWKAMEKLVEKVGK